MRQHVGVHRRGQEHRSCSGKVEGSKEVIGHSASELADDVGRRRRHQQQVHLGGQSDVIDVGIDAGRELIGRDAPLRDRLERQGADEPLRVGGHHRRHVVSPLLETARHFDRLVGADAAADSQCDQRHGQSPPELPGGRRNVSVIARTVPAIAAADDRSATTIWQRRSTQSPMSSFTTT